MQYILDPPDHQPIVYPTVYLDNLLSESELDILQNLARQADSPGVVGAKDLEYIQMRRCLVKWEPYNTNSEWIYRKLNNMITDINLKHYKFNINSFLEPIQLSNYESKDQGEFDWHVDLSDNLIRKLSIIIQLSDPAEYEGGELMFKNNNIPFTVKKQRGLVTLFPSWMLHRVTPVISGTRQTLVQWVSGPNFV